jgi:glycosyltransferase involved in cell wall biosynthesis
VGAGDGPAHEAVGVSSLPAGDPRVRVLVLAPQPFYSARGTPIAVRFVCEGLAQMGHQIDLLTYHVGEPIELPGVTIHRIPRLPFVKRVPVGPSFRKLLCDCAMMLKFRSMIRETTYDLVHAVEESAFFAASARIPFVFDMDSLMSRQILERSRLYWPIARVVQKLESHAIRKSQGVLAVCPALAREAHHLNANVQTLPDVALAGQAPGRLPEAITGAAGLRVMYVGNLEKYQGVDLMLESFAEARRKDATLIVVGGHPRHIEKYRRKAARLGVSEQVRFAGPVPVERIGRVFRHADILVSPRIKGQNTPMKLYSYLLSGKPVLATRLETHTQVMDDDSALLVEPTPAGMAQGMHRLMDSPELRQRLGTSGRHLAETTYSRAAFQHRLEQFYQRIQP